MQTSIQVYIYDILTSRHGLLALKNISYICLREIISLCVFVNR